MKVTLALLSTFVLAFLECIEPVAISFASAVDELLTEAASGVEVVTWKVRITWSWLRWQIADAGRVGGCAKHSQQQQSHCQELTCQSHARGRVPHFWLNVPVETHHPVDV